MKKKCRICKALGNNCAIGCIEYDFVTPYPKDIMQKLSEENKPEEYIYWYS